MLLLLPFTLVAVVEAEVEVEVEEGCVECGRGACVRDRCVVVRENMEEFGREGEEEAEVRGRTG